MPGRQRTTRCWKGGLVATVAYAPLLLWGATELVLGLETVKTHVRNVLAKLGVRDRVQAVITAYESGFIQ